MTIRTGEEILSELARMVVLKPTVIEFNAFGDSNHRSIQACIDVLMYDYSRIEIVQRHGDDENALLHPILTRDGLDGRESEPPSQWGWPLADDAHPVVGHKTFRDGPHGFRHEPLRASEAEVIMASLEEENKRRAELMPTEQDAIDMMWNARKRLMELGWNDAIYCPKDGSEFDAIELGSTGIHRCHYSGTWPNGSWWTAGYESYPSRPVLYRKEPPNKEVSKFNQENPK